MIEYKTDGQLPMPDAGPSRTEREELKVEAGAMNVDKLTTLIEDIQWQPDWRSEADLDCAYYDGFQIPPEARARAQITGQPLAVVNLMSRSINVMLGQEAKARSSWKVTSDVDEYGDVAEAIQVKLVEAQRETYADMAVSDGYESEVKAGIGWVEVSRKADLFAEYPYRVASVHRNEIWWDWRSREKDLSDARWLVRQRWIDLDEAEVMYPQHRDVFRQNLEGWNGLLLADSLQRSTIALQEAYQDFRRFQLQPDEWLDSGRRRIRFYEVWYRLRVPAVAMIVPGRRPVEFNPRNALHDEARRRGAVRLVRTNKSVLRCAIFAGPHRLSDCETNRKRFPYIPFWAYRDDADRTPYGMARGMRYPQDEYNARRSKLMWLLQAAQVFVDDDALNQQYNTFADLANEIMRADGMFVLNSKRIGKVGVEVRRDIQLPKEQIAVMNDAKELIQEQPGIYGAMLGSSEGVQSGIAINSLVEQGVVAQGELNDNYRYGRRMVGEGLVDLIVEDLNHPGIEVIVGLGKSKRKVILNKVSPDMPGVVFNRTKDAPVKVNLDEIPNTPAYRLQQQQQIAQVLTVGGSDQAVRAVLIPSFIEATDLPNREHDARLMRQMYGVPQPGDETALEENERVAAEQRAQAGAAQAQLAQTQSAKVASETLKNESQARLNDAKVLEVQAKTVATVEEPPAQQAAPNEDDVIKESLQAAEA